MAAHGLLFGQEVYTFEHYLLTMHVKYYLFLHGSFVTSYICGSHNIPVKRGVIPEDYPNLSGPGYKLVEFISVVHVQIGNQLR